MLTKQDIRIRDPFILPVASEKKYYMYGTTDENVWGGKAEGFNAYSSTDLVNWEGPVKVFDPPQGFWADQNFWAPEVHMYDGKYYMFASFKSEDQRRGTQILVAENPLGPFTPLTETPVTPRDWECLDGTLFIDDHDRPWMIFCHEWVQVKDGKMCALPLTRDLREADGEPELLFHASEAPWTPDGSEHYVTDGPFMYRTETGELLMLWSSHGTRGYAVGTARSESGTIHGPWKHDEELLFAENGGHGMLFHTFDGQLMLTFHAPNNTPDERPVLHKVNEADGNLFLAK